MEDIEPTDIEIACMMKLALEFNANIVALCTQHYGNIKDRRSALMFCKVYRQQMELYEKQLYKVMGKYEKA